MEEGCYVVNIRRACNPESCSQLRSVTRGAKPPARKADRLGGSSAERLNLYRSNMG